MALMTKQHLGNGVFAEIEDGQIKLTTLGRDNNTENTIYINDEALCGLNQFVPGESRGDILEIGYWLRAFRWMCLSLTMAAMGGLWYLRKMLDSDSRKTIEIKDRTRNIEIVFWHEANAGSRLRITSI